MTAAVAAADAVAPDTLGAASPVSPPSAFGVGWLADAAAARERVARRVALCRRAPWKKGDDLVRALAAQEVELVAERLELLF